MNYIKLFLAISFIFTFTGSFAQPVNYVEEAEIMPRFPGCEDDDLREREKADCSNLKLVKYLSQNITYPELAMQKETEGVVIIDFIVDENGKIIHPELVHDIGEGCGTEAMRVIREMPSWTAGKHQGQRVAVKMRLPVRFNIPSKNQGNLSPDNYRIFWGNLRQPEIPLADFVKIANSTPIIVRNLFGKPFLIDQLTLTYERGSKMKVLKNKGVLNAKMHKMIKKAKEGGKFTVETVIQKDTQFITVKRMFKII